MGFMEFAACIGGDFTPVKPVVSLVQTLDNNGHLALIKVCKYVPY